MRRKFLQYFRRNSERGIDFVRDLVGDRLGDGFLSAKQSIPDEIDAAPERSRPAQTCDAQVHAASFWSSREAFVPPNPNEFERTMSIFAGRALFATTLRFKSASALRKLMFAGSICACKASKQMTASIAPAAPNE